jgi:hypothetical protein
MKKRTTYMSGHAVWLLPHSSQLGTCCDHSPCTQVNREILNSQIRLLLFLKEQASINFIVISNRYIFVERVDKVCHAVTVEVVLASQTCRQMVQRTEFEVYISVHFFHFLNVLCLRGAGPSSSYTNGRRWCSHLCPR